MGITLEIPDSLYKRIQKHAIPFVDLTPISVIERWADHFESIPNEARKMPLPIESTTDLLVRTFDPLQPPDLFHTRSQGIFGSMSFSNWNELVRVAHIAAFLKAKSFEELRGVTHAQIRKGRHSESGYHFVEDIEISIQGVDANHAWVYSLRLAQYLGTSLRALIEWRNNAKAAFPGQRGVLEWKPSYMDKTREF